MARQFTYDDLMALRQQGITAPFSGSDPALPPEQQQWSPNEMDSDEQDYLQLKNAGLVEPSQPEMQPEQRQAVEQNSIFRNLVKAPQPSRQQELETMVGRGAPISADAGLLSGNVEQPAPSRSLASIVGNNSSAAPKKEPSLADILNFGQNDVASKEGLQQAIQRRNDQQMINNVAAAASTIGGGLAKTGPVDTGAFDKLNKQAEQNVTDYEKQVEFQKQDPNSAYSKGLKDYFKNKLGIEIKGDASAAELEKMMPFAVREYEANLERAARKEDKALDRQQRREDKASDRELKQTLAQIAAGKKDDNAEGKAKEKLATNTRLIRKEIFSGPSGKTYNNYLNADRAAQSISKFMENPTGYSDYATLMGGLKALQGDESVVREAEIRLGMDAGSFKDQVLNRIEKLKSGKSLQASQRKAILESVKVLREVTKSQFLQAASPQLAQAEELGIPRDHLISELLDRKQDDELVKVRNKETGKVKGFSKSDANKLLANPDKFEPVQ